MRTTNRTRALNSTLGSTRGTQKGTLVVGVAACSDPKHNVRRDAAVLVAEEGEDVVLRVAERPVDADERRLGEREHERVELRVVRVALPLRRLVEVVRRSAEERDLVYDVAVLGQDLGPAAAQQLDRRVARVEDDALAVRLGQRERRVVVLPGGLAQQRAELALRQRGVLGLEPRLSMEW